MGDLVLPTWAVREEGLSYHYLDPGIVPRPSSSILSRLKTVLAEVPHREGGVWTTDAVFREVRPKLERLAKAGVLAVEMECSALMSIATFRNVEFAALLTITDEVFGQEWREGFSDDIVTDAWLRACKAARAVFD